jgi:hypothetical protein
MLQRRMRNESSAVAHGFGSARVGSGTGARRKCRGKAEMPGLLGDARKVIAAKAQVMSQSPVLQHWGFNRQTCSCTMMLVHGDWQ